MAIARTRLCKRIDVSRSMKRKADIMSSVHGRKVRIVTGVAFAPCALHSPGLAQGIQLRSVRFQMKFLRCESIDL
jgi:hypothetical protein